MAEETKTGQEDRAERAGATNAKIGKVLSSESADLTSERDGSTETKTLHEAAKLISEKTSNVAQELERNMKEGRKRFGNVGGPQRTRGRNTKQERCERTSIIPPPHRPCSRDQHKADRQHHLTTQHQPHELALCRCIILDVASHLWIRTGHPLHTQCP